MKTFLKILILFFFSIAALGQNEDIIKQIDSLNQLPYHQRIETTATNIKKFQKNLESAQHIKYKIGEAESLSNLSLIFYYKGLYDQSVDCFFRAIAIYESIGAYGKAGELYGLYGYRLRQTHLEKAEEFMLKGLKMSETAGNKEVLPAINDNYGLVKEAKKEYDSAFYYYNKSLKMKEANDDKVGIPYSLNKIAALKATLGDYDGAKELFDQAYKIRKDLDDDVGLAENLSFYGMFYEQQKQHDSAIYYLEKALLKSQEAGYNWLTFKIYGGLSENAEAQHDYKKAYTYLKQHFVYKDSIYNIETTSNRNELEVQFEIKEREKEVLEQRAKIAETSLILERKNKLIIGILAVSTLITLIILQFYRIQKLKNQQLVRENTLRDILSKAETQNRIKDERLRISRDLHDNIGSQLTFIILSLDNLKTKLASLDPKVVDQISEINDFARSTIEELRDTIWAMNKDSISVEDLQLRISNFIEKAKSVSKHIQVNYKSSSAATDKIFSSFEGVNIYRIVQESIQNAFKYSDASELDISFTEKNQHFEIEIRDNGKGFDMNDIHFGNGLLIMKKRAADIGANLLIVSEPLQGTKIKLSF